MLAGMAPREKSTARASGWAQADLRIWCVGGWRFQLRGGRVQRLDGPTAEEALARHLAVRHPESCSGPELQRRLSRRADRPIPKQSLHVAANKLRDLLAAAALQGKQEGRELAKKLLPNATSSVEEGSRVSSYRFDHDVWIDLFDAPDPLAFRWLAIDRNNPIELGGGVGSKAFEGFEQLMTDARRSLRSAALNRPPLPEHLKRFTPPIRRLKDLVPVALDRLQANTMLIIEGKADSGRMHLAEAIELASWAWGGTVAEQVRDRPDSGHEPDPIRPGRLYTLDLTRVPKDSQRERLRKIREFADSADPEQRPSLLVVVDELPMKEVEDMTGWRRAKTIQLRPPSAEEVTEAYLIATRELPGSPELRREEFEKFAHAYARDRGTAVGLRAASSAASFAVDEKRIPTVNEISPPENRSLSQLKGNTKEIALALAWFGNDPFTMEDARAATERPDLPRSEVFMVATKIPGGGPGTYELHPALVDERPANEVPRRICRYLLEDGNAEAAERWPLRAIHILSARSVDPELRLRLASALIDLARDFGFADQLEATMRKLLRKVDPDSEGAIEAAIGRARLLTYMGKLRKAEAALTPIVGEGTSATRRLQAEAHLRLAIAASQQGHRESADEHALTARKLATDLAGRVTRYDGWAALYTANFKRAVHIFKQAAKTEDDLENYADARIGLVLALLRLGHLAEAESLLEELAEMPPPRSITRNRIIRAEATAKFLRDGPRPGIEILDKALGRDESRASRQSADLLEARAYLHTKLGGDALAAAEEDLKRGKELLAEEDEWQKAVIFYLQALIAEAKIRAEPREEEAHQCEAKARAEQSVAAAPANFWHQARAHTLLGRLEVEGDRHLLVEHLRAAAAAHRELDAVCPDVLRETLDLAGSVAGAWRLHDERRDLEAFVAELAPANEPPNLDTGEILALLKEVAAAAEAGPPPEVAADVRKRHVKALGKLGDALAEGRTEVVSRGMPLIAYLFHPRDTAALPTGTYEVELSTGDLRPVPDLPAKGGTIVRGAADRRFAVQRLGVILLIGPNDSAATEAGLVELGRWLEAFRAQAQKGGLAIVESIAVEPRALEALDLHPQRFAALGLAELPVLS